MRILALEKNNNSTKRIREERSVESKLGSGQKIDKSIINIITREEIQNKRFKTQNTIPTVGYEGMISRKQLVKFEQDPTVNEEVTAIRS